MFLWLATLTFNLLSSDVKLNEFPGLTVEHFVKFGDPSYIGFRDVERENRKSAVKILPLQVPAYGWQNVPEMGVATSRNPS